MTSEDYESLSKEFLEALDEYHAKVGVDFDADAKDVLEKVFGRSFDS